MSKFKIIGLFDKIFISVAVFLIVYAWINFFIRNLYTTLFLSLIFSSAIICVMSFILNKKTLKKEQRKNHIQDIEEKHLAFRLMSELEKVELINKIVSKNFKTETTKDTITYKDEFDSNHIIIIATNYEKITFNNLLNILENTKKEYDEIEIICNDYDTNINTKFLKNININFINKTKLYNDYFLKNSIFPDCKNLNTEKPKFNIKKIAKNFFHPSKSKGYFFCGLILIFSSIILPYHYYYLIFGTILLSFSVFCKLQKIFICQ